MSIFSVLFLAGSLVLATGSAAAARGGDPFDEYRGGPVEKDFEYDDSNDKKWSESAAELPPLPREDGLLQVKLDRLPAGMTAFMDTRSLQLDPADGVYRFWLVIRSRSGSYNASFEGLRCETREFKVYGYGNPQRSPPVHRADQPSWQPVGKPREGTYRAELMQTLLCDHWGKPEPRQQVIDVLRGLARYHAPVAESEEL